MSKFEVGMKILPFGKSMHAGHEGIVVADYGNYLLVESTEPKYEHAHKNTIGEGKYFQVDALLAKESEDK